MMDLQNEDILRSLEAEPTWNNAAFSCSVCRYKDAGSSCETPKGRLCVSCAVDALISANNKMNIDRWPISKFSEALSPKGRLRWRLLVLERFDAIQPKIKNPDELNQVYSLLVDNLGYVSTHPLAQIVRQFALNRCIHVGARLLPILLEKEASSSWEFYANIVFAAVQIDVSDSKVQQLVQEAVLHSNPDVREKLVLALSSISDSVVFEMLSRLSHDTNFTVRTLARQRLASFKRKSKTESRTSRGINHEKHQRVPVQPTIPERPDLKIAVDDPILMILEEDYRVEDLRKFYQEYLKELVPYEKFGLSDMSSSVYKLRRVDLAFALKTVLESKEMFLKFFTSLPEAAQNILSLVVWMGAAHEVVFLEQQFGCEIFSKSDNRDSGSKLLPAYYLFATKEHYSNYSQNRKVFLYLPNQFRQIFKKYLPFPEFAELHSLREAPKTQFIQELDDGLVAQVFNLFRYVRTGNVNFAKNSRTLLKKSISEIDQHFKIQEYYDSSQKALNHVKLHLLVFLLSEYRGIAPNDALPFLKQMFQDFFSDPKNLHSFWFGSLMEHLKGSLGDFTDQSSEIRFRKSFHKILKSLPPGEWIEFRNLQIHIQCREYFINLIDLNFARYNLSYKLNSAGGAQYRHFDKFRVQADNYLHTVVVPLLKSTLFLFAAFGLLDVAYDLPWADSEEKDYLTPYDGLQAIRLTELGAYILGLKKDFELKTKKQEVKITLDEKHLIIYVEGVDPVKSMLLEKIGEPLNPSCFKVTFQSFLKGCVQQKDVDNRFKFFIQQISSNPPENWQKFLESVKKKMNPLTVETSVAVFKIEPERELIELITRDEILRENIVKAENYRIIVESKNLKVVKKRLEEFGYFIDNW